MIIGLVRVVILQCVVGRKAISRGGKLLAAHAHDTFNVHKVFCCAKVSNR